MFVEQAPLARWSVGPLQVTRAAHIDAIVSASTDTPDEKERFIAEANRLLRSVPGADLSKATYVVVHEVPKDSWGYDGLTKVHRAGEHASA